MRISSTVEKSIEIIRWCLFNKKPLYQGCARFGHTRAYVARACKLYGHIADPQCREMISLYKKLQENDNFHSRREKKKSKGEPQPEAIKEEGVVFDAENGMVDSRGFNHVKTLDEILSGAKVDLNVGEVERHLINKWDVTNAMGGVFQNWQVKVWLKRKSKEELELFEVFLNSIKAYAPEYKGIDHKVDGRYALEISVADLHIGKFGYGKETLDGDYDTEIAIQRYQDAIDFFISQTKHLSGQIDQIILPCGNDLINIDNIRNETSSGTPQSVDSRWHRMF